MDLMSPIRKKKLEVIRKKLDKLDDSLLSIIKKRIRVILTKIRKKSIQKKIDPDITNRIWKNMIWSYINYERKNFNKK